MNTENTSHHNGTKTALHYRFFLPTIHHHHHHHRHQLYSPSWALASYFLLGFVTLFYGVGLLATRPTTNLVDQGIPFCLDPHP
jgi:hypothetical protein